ncbi:MAG: AIM24 family protein [Oscillospiraceae bacterium]|nr:AIM24 family protein [Oscillospiraceae bacterium]
MYTVNNFIGSDRTNPNILIKDELGSFTVIEYAKDLSVTPQTAATAYYNSLMNIRRRQLICDLSQSGATVQSGAMQWMLGDVQVSAGVKSAADLIGKAFKGKATGESAIKPEYSGSGVLTLEPTYKHLILSDTADWGGGVVLDDGLFLACESGLTQKIAARSNFSSAVAGGEGLFNLSLNGRQGVFCLEANCPKEELVEINLQNDVIKIDGNFAIAWSSSLSFTVERTTKTLVGSAASGEGLVNVYRGTGRIWMMPLG